MKPAGLLVLFASIFAAPLAFVISGIGSTQSAFAHNFSGDESATFLAQVEKIDAHLRLVTTNLGADNVELATEHADHAREDLDEHTVEEIAERNERLATDLPAALDDLRATLAGSDQFVQGVGEKVDDARSLLAEAVSVRIDADQRNNSTVRALTLANLGDEVLAQYSAAFGGEGGEGEDHGHGDEMAMETGDSISSSSSAAGGNETTMAAGDTVVDVASLQTAQALAARMQELAADLEATEDTGDAMDAVRSGIASLVDAVNEERPNSEVMSIVHGQIHENLGRAFGLEIAGQGQPITLQGTSAGGTYDITVDWTPAALGAENEFRLNFDLAQAAPDEELFVVTYDIMLLKDGEHIDESHREGQEALVQYYTFDEPGNYMLRIENINNDPEESLDLPIQVVPEFPVAALGLAAGIAASAAAVAVANARRTRGL